jgi:predicted O-methyltransferase YrrM
LTQPQDVGHIFSSSGICWTAWALSKTGGTLTTIEIDGGRYREALKNFKRAGVEHHDPKTPRALTGKAL